MNIYFRKQWLLLLLIFSLIPLPAGAASGLPNSPSFGYGLRVAVDGDDPVGAIRLAGQYRAAWVGLDLDWEQLQPAAGEPPQWEILDPLLAAAAENGVAALISVLNPPDWARGADGPSPEETARLALGLARRYPGELLALELFPHANTVSGWGCPPDPAAYARLLKITRDAVQAVTPTPMLVAGGLNPLAADEEGVPDLAFLAGLYAAGAADFMPIVGLRLPPLGGDPLAAPGGEDVTLRHYEQLRTVMVAHGHEDGLIWVTGFSWDVSQISDEAAQADWMKQAYLVFRSQLFVGAAFFESVNAPAGRAARLLSGGGNPHPGFGKILEMVTLENEVQTIKISLLKMTETKHWRKADSS